MTTRYAQIREVVGRIELADPSADPDIPFTYIDIASIDNRLKLITAPQRLLGRQAPSRARQRVRSGDVLVATTRPNLNAVAIVPETLDGEVCSTGFAVLRANENVDARYLFLFTQSQGFIQPLVALIQGALYPAVTDRDVLAQQIPLPERDIQRRIAADVDKQLAQIKTARAAVTSIGAHGRDLAIGLLREFVPLPPDGPWPWVRLDAAAEFLDSRRRPVSATERAARIKGLDQTKLVPYFGANGLAGWIDDHLFDEPLVLLAEDGGAFGSSNTPIAYRIDGKAWVNNHAHVLRPLPGVDVDFLGYALSIRPDIGEVISGSTRGKLNKSVAAAIRVPLPPFDEQRRIAAELRDRLALIEAMEASIRAELAAIDALPAALLQRAFEGLAA